MYSAVVSKYYNTSGAESSCKLEQVRKQINHVPPQHPLNRQEIGYIRDDWDEVREEYSVPSYPVPPPFSVVSSEKTGKKGNLLHQGVGAEADLGLSEMPKFGAVPPASNPSAGEPVTLL